MRKIIVIFDDPEEVMSSLANLNRFTDEELEDESV